jgi:MFS family permease
VSALPPHSPTPRLIHRAAQGTRRYAAKLRMFSPNARLYLVRTLLTGVAFGVWFLLLNFYILSLGYDQALAGRVLTVNSFVALAAALPAASLCDRLGLKKSLLLSNFAYGVAMLGMAFWRNAEGLYLMSVLSGLGYSLMGVSMGPFLAEHSGEEERTYLFSFNAGIDTTAAFLGNWVGGRLPAWVGAVGGFGPTSAGAYGGAIAVAGGMVLLGMLPLLALRGKAGAEGGAMPVSPWGVMRRRPRLIAKLIAPPLVISLGAGLLMPFMNLFFRSVHGRSDAAIGTLFAWGSLAMALGFLVAPPLAERWGKIRLVVVTQGLSIPFLAMLGFAPWYGWSAAAYLIRLCLMNMNWPVYDAFVMEKVEERERATVASLASMANNVGWSVSPSVSGWLQVQYGFSPLFLGTIVSYAVAVLLCWRFFGLQAEGAVDAAAESG